MAASRDETVKVMVRVRPMNSSEKARGKFGKALSDCANRLQEYHFDGSSD